MDEAEAALGVLLKGFRDADEELLLGEHVVRYQRARASRSAYDLRRGADQDDLVRLFVGQLGDSMLKEIVGSRCAAVGAAEDDDVLLGCWCGGVLRHLHARIKVRENLARRCRMLERLPANPPRRSFVWFSILCLRKRRTDKQPHCLAKIAVAPPECGQNIALM